MMSPSSAWVLRTLHGVHRDTRGWGSTLVAQEGAGLQTEPQKALPVGRSLRSRSAPCPELAFSAVGSSKDALVEVGGIEPPSSSDRPGLLRA